MTCSKAWFMAISNNVCRCYRMMGNAGMVFNLEQIQYVEDKNLLSGHIVVLLGQDFDTAQASAPL